MLYSWTCSECYQHSSESGAALEQDKVWCLPLFITDALTKHSAHMVKSSLSPPFISSERNSEPRGPGWPIWSQGPELERSVNGCLHGGDGCRLPTKLLRTLTLSEAALPARCSNKDTPGEWVETGWHAPVLLENDEFISIPTGLGWRKHS